MSTVRKVFPEGRSRTRAGRRRSLAAVAALLVATAGLCGCSPAFLWGWGYNGSGEIGDSTTISRTSPVQIDRQWTRLSSGYGHTVGIRTDGTLWAWGGNVEGELGDGTTASRNTPTRIGTATDWSSITAGRLYTVAIRTDGTLWAWGYNFFGELGDGTTTSRSTPTQIGTATNWSSVTAG